jgi:hypothetical protein
MPAAAEEKLAEDLVLRGLPTAYLKLPAAFKQRFEVDVSTLPSPDAFLREGDQEIRLCFVWRKNQLKEK